jgi:hypothetical protein
MNKNPRSRKKTLLDRTKSRSRSTPSLKINAIPPITTLLPANSAPVRNAG